MLFLGATSEFHEIGLRRREKVSRSDVSVYHRDLSVFYQWVTGDILESRFPRYSGPGMLVKWIIAA